MREDLCRTKREAHAEMTRLRVLIWLLTAAFVAMMFIPLVREMIGRLAVSGEVPP